MIEDYYNDVCTIERISYANNNGLKKESFTTVVSSLSCKIRLLTGNEIFQNEKQNQVTTHRIYMPIVDVKYNDVVTINSVKYKVKIINNPMGMNEYLIVDCEKIEN